MNKLFLGIDGGQSHTTAVLADVSGRVLGIGGAGPSNHTREPGGRERLIEAVEHSTFEAMRGAGLTIAALRDYRFASAYLALTGEPEDKIAIIGEIIRADRLTVAHDAPAALAGALSGEEGVVVLAGTGSVACGRTEDGRFIRVGGHGYLFGDQGSAFAIARDALAGSLVAYDRGQSGPLAAALLESFGRRDLISIAQDVYAGIISRDRVAGFASRVGELAESGDAAACLIMDQAAKDLANLAALTAERLGIIEKGHKVSYGGGVFRSTRLMERFRSLIKDLSHGAEVVPPRFGPDAGALILAYRQYGVEITQDILQRLSQSMNS